MKTETPESVKAEAEIGVMGLLAKEGQGLQATTSHWDQSMEQAVPQSSQRALTLPTS